MAVCMELMGQSKKGKIYQISELRSVSEKREKPGDASSELGERHLRAIFISELGDFVSPSSGRKAKACDFQGGARDAACIDDVNGSFSTTIILW